MDKRYVYLRDNSVCYHCGKSMKIRNMTIDHYYPKSLGGTFDFYNIVSSCKTCNRLKRSHLPANWEEINIALFKRAIIDKRILPDHKINITYHELLLYVRTIKKVIYNKANTVFEGAGVRFYIKENIIHKIVYFNMEEHFLENNEVIMRTNSESEQDFLEGMIKL